MHDPVDLPNQTHMRERPRLTYAQSLPPQSRHIPPVKLRRLHSLPAEEHRARSRPKFERSVSLTQAVKKYIKRNTASFFGVYDQNEDDCLHVWRERRKRLANRHYGRLKEEYDRETSDEVLPSTAPPIEESACSLEHSVLASTSSSSHSVDGFAPAFHRQTSELTQSSATRPQRQPCVRHRKDSVVKLTWDGLSFLASSVARRRLSRRRSRIHSRSYAPSSVLEDSVFTDEGLDAPAVPLSSVHPVVLDSETSKDDVFFDKIPPPTPTTTVPPRFPQHWYTARNNVMPQDEDVPDSRVGSWQYPPPPRLAKVPDHPQVGMQRIWKQVLDRALDNSNRRQYGMGIMGKLLHRSFRKERITSDVKMQLDDFDDHRPYFTYWVTTVQVLITIISLAVYGLGPIGFSKTSHSALVFMRTLSLEEVDFYEPDNFWIGPRAADLVHLGAKFAPCMRKDKNIFTEIERDRAKERDTACCIRNDNSGCVQSSRSECSTTISTWQKWSKQAYGPGGRISGSVCGQDPSHCTDPASRSPYDWPDDITKWPICKKKITNEMNKAILDHMACEVIGHPCCIGILGECRITTREYCDFVRGFFHEEASLCSQVSCLDDVCGMIRFFDPELPDQFYRLWTSLFLHAGLIHLVITVILQCLFMRDLEKLTGALRLGIIYIMSGITGNLASAIFVPYRAEVGPAGSQFGLFACLFVEVIHSWQMLKEPCMALLKLVVIMVVLFLIGLLPWIDNYAHIVGFVFGFLLSYALLPFVSFGAYDRRRKIILIWVCLLVVAAIFSGLVILFYVYPIYKCEVCKYFNCIPFTNDLCANQDINITRGER